MVEWQAIHRGEAETLDLFTPLDWPDAEGRLYIVLRCFGCYREYRGPRT